MQLEEINALFKLADIKIVEVVKIENRYWPSHSDYDYVRTKYPWWKVTTDLGEIVLGWRKRVISIDWSNTNRRGYVTEDDVTKTDSSVHAYSLGGAVSYLSKIRTLPIEPVCTDSLRTREFVGKEECLHQLKSLFSVSHFLDDRFSEFAKLPAYLESLDPDLPFTTTFTVNENSTCYLVTVNVGGLEITIR